LNKKYDYQQKPLLILHQPPKSAKAPDLNDLRMAWRGAGGKGETSQQVENQIFTENKWW
jgi:hypothetical protein